MLPGKPPPRLIAFRAVGGVGGRSGRGGLRLSWGCLSPDFLEIHPAEPDPPEPRNHDRPDRAGFDHAAERSRRHPEEVGRGPLAKQQTGRPLTLGALCDFHLTVAYRLVEAKVTRNAQSVPETSRKLTDWAPRHRLTSAAA